MSELRWHKDCNGLITFGGGCSGCSVSPVPVDEIETEPTKDPKGSQDRAQELAEEIMQGLGIGGPQTNAIIEDILRKESDQRDERVRDERDAEWTQNILGNNTEPHGPEDVVIDVERVRRAALGEAAKEVDELGERLTSGNLNITSAHAAQAIRALMEKK